MVTSIFYSLCGTLRSKSSLKQQEIGQLQVDNDQKLQTRTEKIFRMRKLTITSNFDMFFTRFGHP